MTGIRAPTKVPVPVIIPEGKVGTYDIRQASGNGKQMGQKFLGARVLFYDTGIVIHGSRRKGYDAPTYILDFQQEGMSWSAYCS